MERAWNCSRSAWPSFSGAAAAAVRMELPLARLAARWEGRGTRARSPCHGAPCKRGLKRGRGWRRVNEGPCVAMPFATPTDGATGKVYAQITVISSCAHQVWIANIHHVATWLSALGVARLV